MNKIRSLKFPKSKPKIKSKPPAPSPNDKPRLKSNLPQKLMEVKEINIPQVSIYRKDDSRHKKGKFLLKYYHNYKKTPKTGIVAQKKEILFLQQKFKNLTDMNENLRQQIFDIKGEDKVFMHKFKNHKRYINKMNTELENTMSLVNKYKKFVKKYKSAKGYV
ncbi:unnamed protein product [Moneuplotes crassus]|uniref:Uncharacterized protein n=1 Tax=Euplotes crassus TaxID=5936 RepID=A0AAD2D821_EUPCR|nr:unnamed protein product [Moneuplotes crassus]